MIQDKSYKSIGGQKDHLCHLSNSGDAFTIATAPTSLVFYFSKITHDTYVPDPVNLIIVLLPEVVTVGDPVIVAE